METIISGQESGKPVKKGNIVLKNLTKEQKQKLMAGQIGLAALAATAGAFTLMGFTAVSGEEPEAQDAAGEAAVICTEAPFATTVTNDMSFTEAFDAARQEVGPGGFFEYNGKLYNTYTQSEWENMTPEQHQEYWQSIDDNTTSITDIAPEEAYAIKIDTPVEPVEPEYTPEPADTEPVYPIEPIEPIEPIDQDMADDAVQVMEVDYLGTSFDSNEDGNVDILIVDADGNEITDMVFDSNYDGIADAIIFDVDLEGGMTGYEQVALLDGVELIINDPYSQDQSDNISGNEYDVVMDDSQADVLNEDDLNPAGNTQVAGGDAPNFENDYDVTDYSSDTPT